MNRKTQRALVCQLSVPVAVLGTTVADDAHQPVIGGILICLAVLIVTLGALR